MIFYAYLKNFARSNVTKIFLLVFFWKSYSLDFYRYFCDPFWVNFYDSVIIDHLYVYSELFNLLLHQCKYHIVLITVDLF